MKWLSICFQINKLKVWSLENTSSMTIVPKQCGLWRLLLSMQLKLFAFDTLLILLMPVLFQRPVTPENILRVIHTKRFRYLLNILGSCCARNVLPVKQAPIALFWDLKLLRKITIEPFIGHSFGFGQFSRKWTALNDYLSLTSILMSPSQYDVTQSKYCVCPGGGGRGGGVGTSKKTFNHFKSDRHTIVIVLTGRI